MAEGASRRVRDLQGQGRRVRGGRPGRRKLVLTIPQDGTCEVIIAPQDIPVVRTDGAYLITGGLGGLGLLLAIQLAGQGARRVVVNGRSAPSADAEQVLARLRDAGTDIVVELGDVAAQDPAWLKLFGTFIRSSFLARLGASNPYKARGTAEQAGISAELAAAVPAARPGIVTAFITGQAASILGTDPAAIDLDRQLSDAGLDSLMALELRARIEKGTSIRVPTKTLWSAGSPAELASHVLGKLGLPADVTAEHPVPAQRPDPRPPEPGILQR